MEVNEEFSDYEAFMFLFYYLCKYRHNSEPSASQMHSKDTLKSDLSFRIVQTEADL